MCLTKKDWHHSTVQYCRTALCLTKKTGITVQHKVVQYSKTALRLTENTGITVSVQYSRTVLSLTKQTGITVQHSIVQYSRTALCLTMLIADWHHRTFVARHYNRILAVTKDPGIFLFSIYAAATSCSWGQFGKMQASLEASFANIVGFLQ